MQASVSRKQARLLFTHKGTAAAGRTARPYVTHLCGRRAVAQQAQQPLNAALNTQGRLTGCVKGEVLQRAGGRLLGSWAAVLRARGVCGFC